MAIVYCAVVKRKKKARKEIIWLNVFTGKFCKQFLSGRRQFIFDSLMFLW
jgi:hypothetical protein